MKIPFEEDIAREIVRSHGLSETTVRVWRNRGHIPAKYANKGYEVRRPLDEVGEKLQKDVLVRLRHPALNASAVFKAVGLPQWWAMEISPSHKMRSSFSELEVNILKDSINNLAGERQKLKSDAGLYKIMKRPEIVFRRALSSLNGSEYSVLMKKKNKGKVNVPEEVEQRAKKDLYEFLKSLEI